MIIGWFFFGIIWAIVGYNLAKKRGRDAGGWAVLCFLFGLFAILVLALIGDSEAKRREKIEEEQKIRMDYEEKRLREKIEVETRIRKEVEDKVRKEYETNQNDY